MLEHVDALRRKELVPVYSIIYNFLCDKKPDEGLQNMRNKKEKNTLHQPFLVYRGKSRKLTTLFSEVS